MRNHRPKEDLIHEVTGLRKQILDLRAGRSLSVPTRHAPDRERPLRTDAGYDSPAELQRIGGALGIFASPEEQSRVLSCAGAGTGPVRAASFRQKGGSRVCLSAQAAACLEHDAVTVAIYHPTLEQ